ncbi:MAG TPA: universal stress protein [Polyangiaceae bacterium]|nr:universal stress protein [Polyangiaceae bacterium]
MNSTTDATKPFIVLVGVDYSDLGRLAVLEALNVARARKLSQVHAVHVGLAGASPPEKNAPKTTPSAETLASEASTTLKSYVERVLAEWQAQAGEGPLPFERLTTHVRFSPAAHAIAQLASDIEADLVVVGTHGRRGFERMVLGSVAEGVVRLAPCPVLVVRPLHAESAGIPQIEPPCPRCLEARRASGGREFWCEQHREHHERRHTYSFSAMRSGHQSGLLYPMFREGG